VLVLAAAALLRRTLVVGRVELPGLAAIGVLDTAANALFAFASRQGLVALVGILGSLYPVVTILLARGVLGERLVALQWGGVTLALAGVALIAGG
jgi:drug/metabolite transporter (DMT)-like permease